MQIVAEVSNNSYYKKATPKDKTWSSRARLKNNLVRILKNYEPTSKLKLALEQFKKVGWDVNIRHGSNDYYSTESEEYLYNKGLCQVRIESRIDMPRVKGSF